MRQKKSMPVNIVGLDFHRRTVTIFNAETDKALFRMPIRGYSIVVEVVLKNITKKFDGVAAHDTKNIKPAISFR